MNRIYCLATVLTLNIGTSLYAQESDSLSHSELPEVVVTAYEQGRRLSDVPAAISVIGTQAFNRFSPLSLVSAVNTAPGVRLEERSPGSYRFNIRGSSLRSPFGVRNVKVYYNDIPFTLPGGTTYFNQLGFYNIRSMEVIKGPGSSLYGAGTGGVLLLESMAKNATTGAEAAYTIRSYNTHQVQAAFTAAGENSTNRVQVQHQQGDGYRQHSAMKRTVADWTGHYRLGENTQLKTTFLFSDLEYNTPGALTEQEYKNNPKAARPGSDAAKAAIYQQTILAGASLEQRISETFKNKTVLYAAATQLRNPNLRGYENSNEPHGGGRTTFTYEPRLAKNSLQIQAGAELQTSKSNINNYKNVGGRADSLNYTDAVRTTQALYFAQASYGFNNWIITGGLSVNSLNIDYQRWEPETAGELSRKFSNEVAGRLALLRKLGAISVYTSVSRGFSPPTTGELLPTGGAINTDLEAESGINYDLGVRGVAGRFSFDANLFYFVLDKTIVQRRDALGGDYYLNSGNTRQRGVELTMQYRLLQSANNNGVFWASYTNHGFRYHDFKPLGNDFGGKRMPGVAPHAAAAGIDWQLKQWGFNLTYFFNDKTPMNDANTAYAGAYHLVGLQAQKTWDLSRRWAVRTFAGADNLLDQKYSLGNDLNAFGGRYYNAAAGRNFFAGVAVQVK